MTLKQLQYIVTIADTGNITVSREQGRKADAGRR